MNGTPWGYVNEDESIAARRTIANIIENMKKINLRLLINFNTKVFLTLLGSDATG